MLHLLSEAAAAVTPGVTSGTAALRLPTPAVAAPVILRAVPDLVHLDEAAPTGASDGDDFDADDAPYSASQLVAMRGAARRTLPPPAPVAAGIAMALLEIEAGCRSATQLERICAPELWPNLEGRLRRRGGPFPTRSSVLRVHCQELAAGLADAVAVVRRGARVAPVALRLDAAPGRWAVTELLF